MLVKYQNFPAAYKVILLFVHSQLTIVYREGSVKSVCCLRESIDYELTEHNLKLDGIKTFRAGSPCYATSLPCDCVIFMP